MQNDLLKATETTEPDDKIDWGRIQAWTQTGILFLMGLYFIDLALPGGNLGNYINVSDFEWLTWVGAAILLLIASMNAIDLLRDKDIQDPHAAIDPNYGIGKPGSFASWLFLAVVAIPLILGLGIPSTPLGAEAISGDQLTSDIRSIGFGSAATLTTSSEKNTILDWVRAFAGTTDLTEFTGEEISVIGFVYRDARFQDTEQFMVVRFTLSCCVADARPIGLVVQAPPGTELAQDTWVNVSGQIEIQMVDGVETPVIVADSIEVTDEPEHPYLYF